ncbi:hypothetical protein BOTBODRAFT_50448 [Botryobasidium botryosum FD-172 SS1]|uniref:Uncharacterized protein n=1 Tax=Botryobasidium botryosum (strain FD-172 SS1) TaxID=930990 RepID=A0A067N1P7_BOTB1|nr:hypothetical protein BOTBODRAFT_50448 [Botryobasidium botryosum FD-172 SS1]
MDRFGGPSKKRKRDSMGEAQETIITYYAPGKTFDRLFKETSLEETKQVVRKKLKLSQDAPLHLLQLRGEKCIELEDDDDFDAFRTLALSSISVDVRVSVPESSTNGPGNPPETPRRSGFPPIVNTLQSTPLVPPVPRPNATSTPRRQSPHGTSVPPPPGSNRRAGKKRRHNGDGQDNSNADDMSTISVPVGGDEHSEIPPESRGASTPTVNDSRPDVTLIDRTDSTPVPPPAPSPLAAPPPQQSSSHAKPAIINKSKSARRKKRQSLQLLGTPTKPVPAVEEPVVHASTTTTVAAATPATAAEVSSDERISEEASAPVPKVPSNSDERLVRADEASRSLPAVPSELPAIAATEKSNDMEIDDVPETGTPQSDDGEAERLRKKEEKKAKGGEDASGQRAPAPRAPVVADWSFLDKPLTFDGDSDDETDVVGSPNGGEEGSSIHEQEEPEETSAAASSAETPAASSLRASPASVLDSVPGLARATAQSSGTPSVPAKRSGSRKATKTVGMPCPICLGRPFHLRHACPVIQAGPESVQARIEELKRTGKEETANELRVHLRHMGKAKGNALAGSSAPALKPATLSALSGQKVPSGLVELTGGSTAGDAIWVGSQSADAEVDAGKGSPAVPASGPSRQAITSGSILSQLKRPFAVPRHSTVSNVTVEGPNEGSSDESDSSSSSSSSSSSEEESEDEGGDDTDIPEHQPSVIFESLDLDALLKGPKPKVTKLLAAISDEEGKPDEEGGEGSVLAVTTPSEKGNRSFKRASQASARKVSPASSEDEEKSEEEEENGEREGSPSISRVLWPAQDASVNRNPLSSSPSPAPSPPKRRRSFQEITQAHASSDDWENDAALRSVIETDINKDRMSFEPADAGDVENQMAVDVVGSTDAKDASANVKSTVVEDSIVKDSLPEMERSSNEVARELDISPTESIADTRAHQSPPSSPIVPDSQAAPGVDTTITVPETPPVLAPRNHEVFTIYEPAKTPTTPLARNMKDRTGKPASTNPLQSSALVNTSALDMPAEIASADKRDVARAPKRRARKSKAQAATAAQEDNNAQSQPVEAQTAKGKKTGGKTENQMAPKPAPAPTVAPTPEPEKRKRGRPKIILTEEEEAQRKAEAAERRRVLRAQKKAAEAAAAARAEAEQKAGAKGKAKGKAKAGARPKEKEGEAAPATTQKRRGRPPKTPVAPAPSQVEDIEDIEEFSPEARPATPPKLPALELSQPKWAVLPEASTLSSPTGASVPNGASQVDELISEFDEAPPARGTKAAARNALKANGTIKALPRPLPSSSLPDSSMPRKFADALKDAMMDDSDGADDTPALKNSRPLPSHDDLAPPPGKLPIPSFLTQHSDTEEGEEDEPLEPVKKPTPTVPSRTPAIPSSSQHRFPSLIGLSSQKLRQSFSVPSLSQTPLTQNTSQKVAESESDEESDEEVSDSEDEKQKSEVPKGRQAGAGLVRRRKSTLASLIKR